MAPSIDHTDHELAKGLRDHADSLIDGGRSAHDAEPLVRQAADRLDAPLLPRLQAEIERACNMTTDPATRAILRSLVIGETKR
jgi:hypothetical protein